MDDVTVDTRSHHIGPCGVESVVEFGQCGSAARTNVVLVIDEINAALSGGMSSNDDAIRAVAGDGAETGLFVLNATSTGNPFVALIVVGTNARATVTEVVGSGHGVAEVDFVVRPNDGPRAGAVVRLPVVGGVVKLTIGAGHVSLALDILKAGFHSCCLLHGGRILSFVGLADLLHLSETCEGYGQGEC